MQLYPKMFFRRKTGIALLIILLITVSILGCICGSTALSLSDFLNGLLWNEGYHKQSAIIYYLRLPRVAAGILAGMGLAVSGVLLQSVTDNPLAGPSIIGVNSGAGFFCILLLSISPCLWYYLPLVAFLGAIITTTVILGIAKRIMASNSTIILAGIACNALLNAGISFLSLLDTDVLVSYNAFSIGSLNGIRLNQLTLPAIIIFLAFALCLLYSPSIQILCLGDSVSTSLGIRPKVVRTVALICASASAGAAVSFAGLLGFVGLVIPHIAKQLCGGSTAYQLVISAICGSTLLVAADLVGRIILAPTEIPVGIIMAFLGVPFLFSLLLKRRLGYHYA